MTLIVGNVMDVGLAGLDGTLRVWAWFRPEEVGLIAPYRREWDIIGGQIEAGVDVIPGPAVVEIDVGLDAFRTIEVTVPDAPEVTIQDLFEQVYTWSPRVVSEAWEARLGAESAAADAESSAGAAAVSAGAALTAEQRAALHAATLSARIEQPGQDVLYTSDGKPYFADPAQIENVPLRVDKTVGTRVFLGDEVIKADTGWRNLDESHLLNGWRGGILRMRRVGDIVYLRVPALGLTQAAATSNIFFKPPLGFYPSTGANYGTIGTAQVTVGNGISEVVSVGRDFNSGLAISLRPNGGYTSAHLFWVTIDAWPASLPGTPG